MILKIAGENSKISDVKTFDYSTFCFDLRCKQIDMVILISGFIINFKY